MSNQLVMNVTPFETRVAYLENSRVAELFIERQSEKGFIGNIYLGRVQRVLPGMQAAFVNIGLDKAAFLYVADVLPHEFAHDHDEIPIAEHEETIPPPLIEQASKGGHTPELIVGGSANYYKKRKPQKRIEELLQVGQKVLVQVAKDPIGSKGPRVSCNISLPGRYVVLMPNYEHIGISRKIVESEERDRLKEFLKELAPEGCGFVARTVSSGVSDDVLKADVKILLSLWEKVLEKFNTNKKAKLLLPEFDIVLKCARDRVKENLEKIIIDDETTAKEISNFLRMFDDSLLSKVEVYDKEQPIFDHFSISSEIDRAMSRKVWLRSGGYLVIDQAEALTAIDVNTGKFVGRRNLEDTILKANLEAVSEIAYQLRLRNIGGMIIVDFIDMEASGSRHRVLSALLEALKKDKARCNVVKISELGLVEMTRQRNSESHERHLCEPCFYCDGRGSIKSKRTVVYDVFRLMLQKIHEFVEPIVVIQAHPEVTDMLLGEESDMLNMLANNAGKKVFVRPRGSFHQEQFDVFGTANAN